MTTLSSGDSTTSTAVTAADPLTVENGATVTALTVSSGGVAVISGNSVSGTVLNSGSLQIVSGGVASATTLSSGGHEVISNGGLDSSAIVQSFGIIDIADGGVASAILLNSGAAPTYYRSGGYTSDGANVVGLDSATSISGPIAAIVEGGGLLNSATMGDATLIVSSGGSATNIIMQSADLSGPAADNGVYATLIVSSGGSISNVSAGDNDEIYEYGTETNITVGGNGASNLPNGTAAGRVTNTYDELASPTASAENDTVSSGAALIINQGSALDTEVTDGGILWIQRGLVSGVTLITSNSDAALDSLQDAEASFAGGTTSNVTAHYAYLYVHGSSTSVTDITVDSRGWLNAYDQGTVLSTTLSGGASATVSGSALLESGSATGSGTSLTVAGASINDFQISDSATATVSSGGILKQTALDTNASASVLSGGLTVSVTLSASTSEDVESGGTASGTLVNGGNETLFSGGIESGGTVDDGVLIVSSGGSAVSVTLTATDTAFGSAVISSGGVTSNTTVVGPEDTTTNYAFWVSAGGAAYNTVVSHEVMVVDSSAHASGVTLNDASITVKGSADNVTIAPQDNSYYGLFIDGGTVSGIVASRGHIEAYNNGSIYGDTIESGSVEYVYSSGTGGATSYDADVQSGGRLSTFDVDATVISATVEADGMLQVKEQAIASNAAVNGTMTISSNGSAIDTQLLSGGVMTINASLGENTIVSSGGEMTLSSGGVGSNTLVSLGGQEIVSSGGMESGSTISGDLSLTGSGALGQQISLLDGGTIEVADNAVVSGLNAVNGAITVDSGASVNNLSAQGGVLTITGSGILSGGVLSANTSLHLASGALVQDLTFTSGTITSVTDTALLSATRLSSDTVTTIASTGSGQDLTVSGGQLLVSAGGIVSAATVSDSGDIHIYGGQVSSVTLAGGSLEIDDDGYAADTQVLSGGLLAVGDPSISENAIVSSGGVMTVSSGGVGSGTFVESGGQESVLSGSLESGGTVSGGLLTIGSGGSAVSVTLATADATSPSTLVVASGGAASSTLIEDQSIALVAGSTVSDTISGANAQEIVSSGGIASGATIDGGGTLTVLNDGQASSVTVENGTLSLSGTHASASSVILESSGHITLADGAVLNGSISDAGTMTVQSGGTVSNLTILSGGRLTISSGGTGLETTLESGAVLVGEEAATVDGTTISSGALLQIDNAAISSDTYLTSGGSIELLNTSWSDTDTVSFTDDILTIDDDGTAITLNLSAADNAYFTKDFVLSQADTDPLFANSKDILITLAPVACFCRGTLIETEFGPMLIENILEGTGILTRDGNMATLRWKAVRRYSHRQMVLGAALRPLVIRADALGDGLPRRDLHVSQLHMLLIDERFIPAAALINDRTIFIKPNVAAMDYYHLDIGAQDIIFAEGVETESLTDDDGSRRGFDNYDQSVAALPSSPDVVMAAPLIRESDVIATLQARYARRAALLGAPFQRICENDLLLL